MKSGVVCIWAVLYLLFVLGTISGAWFFNYGLFPDAPTLGGYSQYPQQEPKAFAYHVRRARCYAY
jgi:hypothetical protein